MAYVYANATNVSLCMIFFGLIQIVLFIGCFFGCSVTYENDFASPGWSGCIAVFTGLVGGCMVLRRAEVRWAKCFFGLAVFTTIVSIANLAIILTMALFKEIEMSEDRASSHGHSHRYTGVAIYGIGIFAGLCVLISSCVASWMNCCCESSPNKGYVVAVQTIPEPEEFEQHEDEPNGATPV